MDYFFYHLKYKVKGFFRRWWFIAEKWYLVQVKKRTHICPRRNEIGVANQVFKGPDYWRQDGTCSYCGSLNPDRFLEEVQNGVEVEPTDKSYKAYLHTKGRQYKIYFQHFEESHRTQFVELYNNYQMKIGYPGNFYTKPYFIQIKKGNVSLA